MNRLARIAVLVTVALGMLIPVVPVSPGGGSIGAVAAIAGSGHDLVVVMMTLILVAVAASHRLRKGPSS
jgi:hypothetical protein